MLNLPKSKIPALVQDCKAHGIVYGWGAKAHPITLQAAQLHALDCSGFARWALFHASLVRSPNQPFLIVDGSVDQHQWCKNNLQSCSNADGHRSDDKLRIAFLKPKYDANGKMIEAGHVMLLEDGWTMESHGHLKGPDRRLWGSDPFMAECELYIIAELV